MFFHADPVKAVFYAFFKYVKFSHQLKLKIQLEPMVFKDNQVFEYWSKQPQAMLRWWTATGMVQF